MADPVTGGCQCGAVRYRLTQAPRQSVVCHCEDCRRAVGAQSVAWLILPSAGFEVTRGALASYRSSLPVTRTFCATCGTTIGYQHADTPERIDVTVGSLDDPERFPPDEVVLEKYRLSWASRI